jgi:hypothetical protein
MAYESDCCRICDTPFAAHSTATLRRCANMLTLRVQEDIRRRAEAEERYILIAKLAKEPGYAR